MLKKKIIDGQELFFLTEKEWIELLDNGSLEQIKINELHRNLISKDIDLHGVYNELFLTVGHVRDRVWLPYMLLDCNNDFIRISIQKRKCCICGWEGYVGLPLVIDLYIGVPYNIDKFELMNKSKKIGKKRCPSCDGEGFKDFVVWTESIPPLARVCNPS